jgi:hypothetical protein
MRLKLRAIQERIVINFYKRLGYKIVHFLHIGKTGGTAIKSAMLENNGVVLKKYLIKNKCLFALHKHNFHLDSVKDGEYAFFVIRDPIERFVSGFYSRMRKGLPHKYNRWRPEEEQAFNFFSTPNQLAEALSNSDPKIREEAISAMKNILHVRNSVWEWFLNEEFFLKNKHKFVFILKQKTLNHDFKAFQDSLRVDLGELPTDPIKAHQMPTNLDKKLSDLAIQNLKDWYKRDYEFLDMLKQQQLIDHK